MAEQQQEEEEAALLLAEDEEETEKENETPPHKKIKKSRGMCACMYFSKFLNELIHNRHYQEHYGNVY